MRKSKFLCTAICAFALCGLILTGCEKGNETTETEISEASVTSESVSETVQTEAETVTESDITEAEEMKEYDPVPESTFNYDKIKDRIIFEDGENTLTAGQYIDALENFDGFINGFYYYYIFQIMDIDKNGIPEILLSRDDTVFVCSELCTVTAEGKGVSVQIANHDVYYDIGRLRGGPVQPYEKDGETLWISHFNTGGTGGETRGNCLLKYNGSGIDGEQINESTDVREIGYDENGDWYYYCNHYYYIFGEEVTEEEYDRRRDEYMNSLKPSDELYVESYYDDFERFAEYEFRENLSYTLNKYLDMRDGAYENAYTQLANKKIGDISAQKYVDAVMACEDFSESGFSFQLADFNSDGMPEVIAYVNEHYRSAAQYYSVSADGKAALLPVQKNKLNDSDHIEQKSDDPDMLIGKWAQGYEMDGETVWVGSFENRHAPYTSVIREAYGDYILKFDGKTVSQEI
ncbi:MAG: hypothetical protein K2H23_08040, partial [Oscillospiraceae bacterium]|nr:hypothetical protein [Oscillospiraceae bacterium]